VTTKPLTSKPPVTKPPLRSSAPRPTGERRSREPLKFRPAQTPLQAPRTPSVVRPTLAPPPSAPASSRQERVDPRARTLLATPAPAAAVVSLQSRRMPPPLPVQAVERFDTLPDTELTEITETSELLDDSDVEDADVEDADIDDLLDDELGATSHTTPPPAPSSKTSKKSIFAVVGGVVVSIAGMAAALFIFEGDPLTSGAAAAPTVAMATLGSLGAPNAAPPPAQAALAAKTTKAPHAANKPGSSKPKASAKAPRANSKHGKPPVPRAMAKKAGKAPGKK
jgi:hypothetical protein